jgi:hypothetical protein
MTLIRKLQTYPLWEEFVHWYHNKGYRLWVSLEDLGDLPYPFVSGGFYLFLKERGVKWDMEEETLIHYFERP